MKTAILRLLKETADYVSGQELCQLFGVSRTAVWKVIRQLEEEGCEIEAVRNKGYRLVGSGDIVTRAELESSMVGNFGKNVEYHDIVDSTNIRAKHLAEEGAPHGMLVVADCQEKGRGRRGRTWVSLQGKGIFMSLILRPELLPSSASMITLVAALAVNDGIKEATGLDTAIKWPNDIVINGKKVCGILTEMSAELEGIHYVVVGIGINANMTLFPEDVGKTATSLCLELNHEVKRSQIIALVMKNMEKYYDKFLNRGDLSGLVADYDKRMVNIDREVKVLDPVGDYIGKALGINEKGELLVELSKGDIRRVVSGEVSVRGIYGYV